MATQMSQPGKLITLCPAHLVSLDFSSCTRGHHATCSVEYVRDMKRRGEAKRSKTVVIPDDVADLPVSRQRKIQIAWKRLGRCMTCGGELYGKSYCLYHHIKVRERNRRNRGSNRRNLNAPSYHAEAEERKRK